MTPLLRSLAKLCFLNGAALYALPALAHEPVLPRPEPVLPYDLTSEAVGVVQRSRPEYEARGLDVAGWKLHPSVDLAGGYTSNVFGTRTGVVSDALAIVRPTIEATLGGNERFATLKLAADLRRHLNHGRADETGLSADFDGSVTIGPGTLTQAGASARRMYERPGSGSFPAEALARIAYNEFAGYARVVRRGSRVRLLAAVDATNFDFKDAQPAFGGLPVDQDDRDHSFYRGSARVELALSGAINGFVEGSYSKLDYRRGIRLDGTPNLDGDRWDLKGGLLVSTGKLRGGLGVGHVRRSFESPTLGGFSGLAIDASLLYLLSDLTTVTLTARRSIEEGGAVGSNSFFDNSAEVQIDHELLRNLILQASVAYAKSKYEASDREDKNFLIRGSARYLISPNLQLHAEASFLDRDSKATLPGPQFQNASISAGVIVRF